MEIMKLSLPTRTSATHQGSTLGPKMTNLIKLSNVWGLSPPKRVKLTHLKAKQRQ